MRASLKKAARTRHDDGCRFGEGLTPDGYYVIVCTEACALKALGDGNAYKGGDKMRAAEVQIKRKVRNRKYRLARKKRRGWA